MGVWSNKKETRSEHGFVSNQLLPQRKSVIGHTIVINGEVESDEEVLIEGKIEGFVKSKGLVVIGKTGIVDAEVEANEVIVVGKINGNVNGVTKVEIKPEGEVNGNIVSQRVVLAEGAIFKGNIDMSSREK